MIRFTIMYGGILQLRFHAIDWHALVSYLHSISVLCI